MQERSRIHNKNVHKNDPIDPGIVSHEINFHEINSHEIISYQIFAWGQLSVHIL